MTLRDWLQAGVALLVIFGALANVRVSMVLRERDRKDHEQLREDFEKHRERVDELVGDLRVQVAEMRGKP